MQSQICVLCQLKIMAYSQAKVLVRSQVLRFWLLGPTEMSLDANIAWPREVQWKLYLENEFTSTKKL